MKTVAKRTIILCIAVLHLALILPSSAGSVTCVDGDGLIKIEANCEQACVCEDQPVAPSNHQTHDHDDCGDCTHFHLSTLLLVAIGANQFHPDLGPLCAIESENAWDELGLTDLKLQGRSWFGKNRPLLAQRIVSLKTTIIIC